MIEEDINDSIDAWHDAPEDNVTLMQYLGMTSAEYTDFVKDPTSYICKQLEKYNVKKS